MAIWIPADVPVGKTNALAYVMHIKAEEKAAKRLASTWAGRQGLIARHFVHSWNRQRDWDIYDSWAYTYPKLFRLLEIAIGETHWTSQLPRARNLVKGWNNHLIAFIVKAGKADDSRQPPRSPHHDT